MGTLGTKTFTSFENGGTGKESKKKIDMITFKMDLKT